MTMPTWSSNLSGAHLNRTKVVIACISAAHTTMSKLGSIYNIWDDPYKKLTRLLLHIVSKYRHFQQRTSNAKRCPLRRLLLRRVLILAAAVMVRRKGAATSAHGRWKMTTAGTIAQMACASEVSHKPSAQQWHHSWHFLMRHHAN